MVIPPAEEGIPCSFLLGASPAHVGVPRNERADVLAADAATRLTPYSPVPFRDVFLSYVWQSLLDGRLDGRYRAQPYVHMQGRRSETALARLGTGHTRLTHGCLMSVGVQPYCDDCAALACRVSQFRGTARPVLLLVPGSGWCIPSLPGVGRDVSLHRT